MYKAIIFDLDGTLLNTLEDLNAACNYALKKYGYEEISLTETKNFIGNGIAKLIERSLKGKLEKFPEVFIEFKKYYKENCNVFTKPYPGITKLLNELKNKRFKLGILSNKAQFALEKIVDFYFPNLFDQVLGDQEGLRKKPEIDGLIKICNDLNVELSEIIYVGDSIVDIETTYNANCMGLFVSYGFGNVIEMAEKNVRLYKDTNELRKAMEELL